MDGVKGRADQLDAVLLEDAQLVQRNRRVEGGLPAQRGEQRVRSLAGDHLGNHRGRDRLDIGRVRVLEFGHDRRWVAVDEHDAQTLGAQHPAGLGAG